MFKVNEECVRIVAHNPASHMSYEGRYNVHRHLFEGWTTSNLLDDNYSEITHGGDLGIITVNRPLTDLMVIGGRVMKTLDKGFRLRANDGRALPVVNRLGQPLGSGITADNVIMLIYDGLANRWVLLDSTDSVLFAIVDILNARESAARSALDERMTNLETETAEELKRFESSVGEKLTDLEVVLRRDLGDDLSSAVENLSTVFSGALGTLRTDLEASLADVDRKHTATEAANRTELVGLIGALERKLDESVETLAARIDDAIRTLAGRPGNIYTVVSYYTADGATFTFPLDVTSIVDHAGALVDVVHNHGETEDTMQLAAQAGDNNTFYVHSINIMNINH